MPERTCQTCCYLKEGMCRLPLDKLTDLICSGWATEVSCTQWKQHNGVPEGAEDKPEAIVVFYRGKDKPHDGRGWYYIDAEYEDEGSVGSFDTKLEAREHAVEAGYWVAVHIRKRRAGNTKPLPFRTPLQPREEEKCPVDQGSMTGSSAPRNSLRSVSARTRMISPVTQKRQNRKKALGPPCHPPTKWLKT